MIDKLLELQLSEEAKAVVAAAYCTNVSSEVTTFIELKSVLNAEIVKKIINLSWGEGLDKYIKFIDNYEMNEIERLYLGESEVRNCNTLFAVSKAENGCYLIVNHALADECTLKIIKKLVEEACEKGINSVENDLVEGRRLYDNYIKRQKKLKKNKVLMKNHYSEEIAPVKISELGRLAWSNESKHICLSKIIKTNKSVTKKDIIKNIVLYLKDSCDICEGNIICSSKNWRLDKEKKAIGMMTGLISLSLSEIVEEDIGLEVAEKYDKNVNKLLKCCRNSELFINGTVPRGIEASKVIDRTFPVGIEVKKINETNYVIEVEGKLKSRESAESFIEGLSEFLLSALKTNE